MEARTDVAGVTRTLKALRGASAEVEACALISHDGHIVACRMSPEVDADRFGAMCASLLALASRAASEVDRGELRQIILDGSRGPVILIRAGEAGVLAVAATRAALLGKLLLEVRRAAQALAAPGSAVPASVF